MCFSFYYTDFAVNIIRNNDPIMKEIIRTKKNYEEKSTDAVFFDSDVVPGIKGMKVDVEKSYINMKKYGKFNDSLLVFEGDEPKVSINNIYDKYIKSGNKNSNRVSLVFKVMDDTNIEKIVDVLDSKNIKATFFIDKAIIDNSFDIIKLLNNSNHQIEYYSDTYAKKEVNKYKKKLNQKLSFCYLEKENKNILTNCMNMKMHTIIPGIITNNYPYSDIKTNITNGDIVSLNTSKNTLRELKYIINYIKQHSYKIVKLNDLIKE